MGEADDPLWRLAERRIVEAMQNGEFDDLPGDGRPLELDDDALVPESLRVAYRLLKNAGFVPEEVRLRREIHDLGTLLAHLDGGDERIRAGRRLELLRVRLGAAGHALPMTEESAYRERLLARLGGD